MEVWSAYVLARSKRVLWALHVLFLYIVVLWLGCTYACGQVCLLFLSGFITPACTGICYVLIEGVWVDCKLNVGLLSLWQSYL